MYNDQSITKYFVVLPDFWGIGRSVWVKNSNYLISFVTILVTRKKEKYDRESGNS